MVGARLPLTKFWFDDLSKRIASLAVVSRISVLKVVRESSGVIHHLYFCGFERDHGVEEVHTRWVRSRVGPFNSGSMAP